MAQKKEEMEEQKSGKLPLLLFLALVALYNL
jgi:hypothetical protein